MKDDPSIDQVNYLKRNKVSTMLLKTRGYRMYRSEGGLDEVTFGRWSTSRNWLSSAKASK